MPTTTINARVDAATKAAIRAAAQARGEPDSDWLRDALLTVKGRLPEAPVTGALDENIKLRLSPGARHDLYTKADRAGLDPSEYIRRVVAARLRR